MEWKYVQIKNTEPKYKNRFNRLKRRATYCDAKMAATAILEELPTAESKTFKQDI